MLSPETRAAALKLTGEGKTQAEVAERLRVSPSTIQSFLAKALPAESRPDRGMCGDISLTELLAMRDAEVPVPAIADAAGVTPANVYYHLRRLRPCSVSRE